MSRRKFLIAPSVLGADPLALAEAVESLKGRHDWLHLDIMDGHFVRNLSFGPAVARAMRRRWPEAFIDVHLMVDRLDVVLPLFLNSGASLITIHAETEPQLLHAALGSIRAAGLQAGVAIGPATPVEMIRPVLDCVDLVLVMSVTPGFGGQSLIESTLERTRQLAQLRAATRGYSYLIEMDGGINLDNAPRIALAGCDVAVAGSSVFSSPDPAAYLDKMKSEVKEAFDNAEIGADRQD
ncbi:MAG: ribulose-phosphate 3-epimerase [Fretibacterium sp.]|nr:ribulose-phosphate 3-epimerase [Fretibacterium sp.]